MEKKYKICIYAICKNEEKFIDRWFNSVKEADEIYVLDTGSTDNSVNKLKKLGVVVKKQKIEPWRFDVARNISLDMIPDDYDICICIDLDEVLTPGWRNKLENIWNKNTDRIKYIYNWKLDANDKPLVSFYYDKIHSRKNYKWIYPVHEILNYQKEEKENIITTDEIIVNHYPDEKKSRNSYLPLLELSVKENPTDDRNMHYLGREYMFHHEWNKCIDTLIKHLDLPTATWKDERCASMRYILRSYKSLKRYKEAKMWGNLAINEAPYLRDPYMEMAILEYELGNYEEVIKLCNTALKIKTHPKTYINEIFSWDMTIYDLLSISLFYENKLEESLKYLNIILENEPHNKRIIDNKKIIENMLKTTKKQQKKEL